MSVSPDSLVNIGIRNIKPQDIQYANEKGLRIKLFASATKDEQGISAFVAPHFIESSHSAYYVDDEFNAVVVQAAYADKQLFYGKGAGSLPTASAVLSDISALQFNYRYEYRKSTSELQNLTSDIELYVYLSSAQKEALDQIRFEEIDDLYVSKGYCYKIGKIRFSEIQRVQWNDQKELTLLIFSDSSNRKFKNSEENNYYNFQYN